MNKITIEENIILLEKQIDIIRQMGEEFIKSGVAHSEPVGQVIKTISEALLSISLTIRRLEEVRFLKENGLEQVFSNRPGKEGIAIVPMADQVQRWGQPEYKHEILEWVIEEVKSLNLANLKKVRKSIQEIKKTWIVNY